RELGAKELLVYALTLLSEHELVTGRLDVAREHANEALVFARALESSSNMVIAMALLARVAARGGDAASPRAHIDETRALTAGPRARRAGGPGSNARGPRPDAPRECGARVLVTEIQIRHGTLARFDRVVTAANLLHRRVFEAADGLLVQHELLLRSLHGAPPV